jgi:hypothetical protein
MGLKTALILSSLSLSAFADYRFSGTHPYSINLNEKKEIILKLCYENFSRCTAQINIGHERELKSYLQEKIWRRKDVKFENYESVLKESKLVLKKHQREVASREKVVKDLTIKDPSAAESLKNYITEAKIKVRDAEYAIKYLISGKETVDAVLQELDDTLSKGKTKNFSQTWAYNFEDFEWRKCRSMSSKTECFESGIQYFINGKPNFLNALLETALVKENKQIGLPQSLSSGLKVAVLTTDRSKFGTSELSQLASEVPTEIGGEDYNKCFALKSSGTVSDSQVGCEAFGKNWRYPTLKELKNHQTEILSIIPEIEPERYLQTKEVRAFMNPGAVHLKVCKSIYYNLRTDKALNNLSEIMRDFSKGKNAQGGASAVCVCSDDC